jgi:hypothetical protein
MGKFYQWIFGRPSKGAFGGLTIHVITDMVCLSTMIRYRRYDSGLDRMGGFSEGENSINPGKPNSRLHSPSIQPSKIHSQKPGLFFHPLKGGSPC